LRRQSTTAEAFWKAMSGQSPVPGQSRNPWPAAFSVRATNRAWSFRCACLERHDLHPFAPARGKPSRDRGPIRVHTLTIDKHGAAPFSKQYIGPGTNWRW